jgi:hypothetical protein
MSRNPYIVQSPVLFLVFNRPVLTKRVFEEIRASKPSTLYIAADGPRPGNQQDLLLCPEVRSIVSLIDWPCNFHTLFNETNRGCKNAVSAAIRWFFDREDEGIILEDDCVPASSFFRYCDDLLSRYRSDQRIFCITGSNAQEGNLRGPASYYFSGLCNIWGWASWKRVWNLYDPDLKRYTETDAQLFLSNHFNDPVLVEYWISVFRKLKAGKTDTWDQQFQFIAFFENGLCATPNVNLVSNIGFGNHSTHTHDPLDHNANRPLGEISVIEHAAEVVQNKEADYFLMSHEFKLEEKRIKYEKDKLLRRRIKRWLRGLFVKN